MREKILNESNYFHPNIGNKILSIKNKSQNKAEMLDSLALEINTISKIYFRKRKQIFGIINNHFALNININVDNSLNEKDVISIIENTMEKHGVQNDYHFSINRSIQVINSV